MMKIGICTFLMESCNMPSELFGKANQRKSTTVKFYFENEIEIYSTNSKNHPIEGIEILVKAEYLLK